MGLRHVAGRSDAYSPLCGNTEVSWQPSPVFVQECLHHAHAVDGALVVEPQKHHTVVTSAAAKDELAEILVVRNEDSALACGLGHDHFSGAWGMVSVTARTSWPAEPR